MDQSDPMDVAQAHARVIKSRCCLDQLSTAYEAGKPNLENLPNLDAEIELLEDLANEFRVEAQDIIPILAGWLLLRIRVRERLD
jgi:hypothetical protein